MRYFTGFCLGQSLAWTILALARGPIPWPGYLAGMWFFLAGAAMIYIQAAKIRKFLVGLIDPRRLA